MNQKGFIPTTIFVIALLILIGLGVYVVKPRINLSGQALLDETAEWKTYHNSKYNFSFKYPAEFGPVKEINNGEKNKNLFRDRILFMGNNGVGQIDISNKSGYRNAKDFPSCKLRITDTKTGILYPCLIEGERFNQVKDVEEFDLDRIPAVSFYMEDFSYGSINRIIQTTQEPFIQLEVSYMNTKFTEQFPKIFSTFKFTK